MAFRAPLRFEQPSLFIDCVCVCLCVLDEMAALLVRLSRDVLGAGGLPLCCTCGPEPQD